MSIRNLASVLHPQKKHT